jgi:hypothetical protein
MKNNIIPLFNAQLTHNENIHFYAYILIITLMILIFLFCICELWLHYDKIYKKQTYMANNFFSFVIFFFILWCFMFLSLLTDISSNCFYT